MFYTFYRLGHNVPLTVHRFKGQSTNPKRRRSAPSNSSCCCWRPSGGKAPIVCSSLELSEHRSTLRIEAAFSNLAVPIVVRCCGCGWGETARVTSLVRMVTAEELRLWRAFGWVKAPWGCAIVWTGRHKYINKIKVCCTQFYWYSACVFLKKKKKT